MDRGGETMEPKVSIVVPVYNVEQFLPQCIDSLLEQTLKDIEIILVDDGSPDNCGEIAEQYAQTDSRIKVIHQNNAGLGPARNSGIQAASGEYIGFVDSDDWARPEMFQRLYQAAIRNHADIVVGGYRELSGEKILALMPNPLAGNTLDAAAAIQQVRKRLYGCSMYDARTNIFPVAVWTSLYRRTLIHSNEVCFFNVFSEDTFFNLEAYRYAKVITFTDDTDYCYRKEGQCSITQTFSDTKLEKYKEYIMLLEENAAKENDPECLMRIKRKAIDCHRSYIEMIVKSSEPLQKKIGFTRSFSEDPYILQAWKGYPIATLPLIQRLFHKAIINRFYTAALLMSYLRQMLKQIQYRLNSFRYRSLL